uniref:DOMON domain-containing protein n=1 Tax=Setaria digitata TaxID=48799 RepID=A0A915PJL5_9BILA
MNYLRYLVMTRCYLLIALAALISPEFLVRSSSSMEKSAIQSSRTSFWITVEPVSVEWANGCLVAAGCADSRLTLSEWNLVSDERISSSWSIHENFDSSHMFVSYWSKGRPADITFNYEVEGADPIYGFSRTCDSTRTIRLFDNKHQLMSKSTEDSVTSAKISLQQFDKITLNLTGKCFNSTVIVQIYESTCPWCSCGDGYAIVGQLSESESREFLYHVNNSDALVDLGLLGLSAIAVATSAAFSCVLIAYLRERRSNFEKGTRRCEMKCCSNNSTICRGQQPTLHKKRLTNTEIIRYHPTRDYSTLLSHQMESNQSGTGLENNVSGCRIAVNDWSVESALLDGYNKPIDALLAGSDISQQWKPTI